MDGRPESVVRTAIPPGARRPRSQAIVLPLCAQSRFVRTRLSRTMAVRGSTYSSRAHVTENHRNSVHRRATDGADSPPPTSISHLEGPVLHRGPEPMP